MALSTHELYLVLRARDEASRVLRGFAGSVRGLDSDAAALAQKQMAIGGAMMSLGVGAAAMGAAGVVAFNEMTNAAIEYEQQVALTKTQTDDVAVSLEKLGQMGIDVAKEIPVPFEQIQSSLFDIFSSIDVSVPEAERLLENFAKQAVGGNTDMQTAGRATIAILNALGYETSEVERVSDVMFQMVRKGVGTYDEFGTSIGRALPALGRTGQEIETLGGMMTFLTRNGLSTDMAATSAARALEAMAQPKVAERLKEMGVETRKANGEFRPMIDIWGDMNEKFSQMTAPERAKALNDLFKGAGGTIQARRFFDPMFKNFDEFEERMAEMPQAAGAMEEAYAIMSNTPEAKIQALRNQYQIMSITIGKALIPAKMELIELLTTIVGWFNDLSPRMQKNIALFAGIAAVVVLVLGVVTALAGVFLMFAGMATMAGVALSTVGIVIAAVVAALVLIGVAIWAVIKYHEEILAFLLPVWEQIKDGVGVAVDFIIMAWEKLVSAGKYIWGQIVEIVVAVVGGVQRHLAPIVDAIITSFQGIWATLQDLGGKFAEFGRAVWEAIGPHIMAAIESFKGGWNSLMQVLRPIISELIAMWPQIQQAIANVFTTVITIVMGAVGLIIALVTMMVHGILQLFNWMWPAIQAVLHFIIAGWILAWEIIRTTVAFVWPFIVGIIEGALNVIMGVVQFFIALFTGDWDALGKAVLRIWEGMFKIMISAIGGAVAFIVGIVLGFVKGVISWFKYLYDILVGNSIVPDMVMAIIRWFTTLDDKAVALVKDLMTRAINYFTELGRRAGEKVKAMVDRVATWFREMRGKMIEQMRAGVDGLMNIVGSLAGRVQGALGDAGSWLYTAGRNIIAGLANGITSAVGWATDAMSGVLSRVRDMIPMSPVKAGPLRVLNRGRAGAKIIRMIAAGMLQEGDAIRKAMIQVTNIDPSLNAPVVSVRPGDPGDGSGGYGGHGGGGPMVEQYIYTQEIDPVKHAADLGYEVSRRLGGV
jgi:TP901 family phage tail tape measure protein